MHVASVHFAAGPLLRRSAGYDAHIGARLPRQSAPAGEPGADPARPGIVGGCGKPEISEFAAQLAQELRRFGDCLERVEGIGKTAPGRRGRHELRHALRPGAAYRRRVEPALLPNEPGEEIDRQIIFRRRRRVSLLRNPRGFPPTFSRENHKIPARAARAARRIRS